MKRLSAIAVLAMFLAACAGGEETTTVPDETTTAVPDSTTTAAPETTTVTTAATTTVPLCSIHPIPDSAVQVQSRNNRDVDGDGANDTLIGYRVGDTWFLRVVLATGSTLEDVVIDYSGTSGVKPLGSHNIDDSGPEEIFAVVGNGAYTQVVGVWAINNCSLDRLLIGGAAPATFLVGSSVMNINGITCSGIGHIDQLIATYVSDELFEGGVSPFTRTGPTTLTQGFGDGGTFTPAQAMELGALDCPGVSLS